MSPSECDAHSVKFALIRGGRGRPLDATVRLHSLLSSRSRRHSPTSVSPAEARAIAKEASIYGFPLVPERLTLLSTVEIAMHSREARKRAGATWCCIPTNANGSACSHTEFLPRRDADARQ